MVSPVGIFSPLFIASTPRFSIAFCPPPSKPSIASSSLPPFCVGEMKGIGGGGAGGPPANQPPPWCRDGGRVKSPLLLPLPPATVSPALSPALVDLSLLLPLPSRLPSQPLFAAAGGGGGGGGGCGGVAAAASAIGTCTLKARSERPPRMLHVRVMASMVVAAVGAHLRLSKSIVLPLGIIDTEQSRKPMAAPRSYYGGTGLHVVVWWWLRWFCCLRRSAAARAGFRGGARRGLQGGALRG